MVPTDLWLSLSRRLSSLSPLGHWNKMPDTCFPTTYNKAATRLALRRVVSTGTNGQEILIGPSKEKELRGISVTIARERTRRSSEDIRKYSLLRDLEGMTAMIKRAEINVSEPPMAKSQQPRAMKMLSCWGKVSLQIRTWDPRLQLKTLWFHKMALPVDSTSCKSIQLSSNLLPKLLRRNQYHLRNKRLL